MSDIIEEIRGWRDERGYPTPGEMLDKATDEIARLRAEVERLRLTDAEREAVAWAAMAAKENWQDWTRAALYDDRYGSHAAKHEAREATLLALAERHRRIDGLLARAAKEVAP